MPNVCETLWLREQFESLQTTLTDDRFAEKVGKPLGYWALPSDRGLPYALLEQSLSELLSSRFEQVAATPGVGPKKLGSLVELLRRATIDESSQTSSDTNQDAHQSQTTGNGKHNSQESFDPNTVGETQWQNWRETVECYNLGAEKLGRLAPSLRSMPSTIWHSTFSDYLKLSLAELREQKSHGVKRVNAILEVFFAVNEVFSRVDSSSPLGARLAPRQVLAVESWLMKLGTSTEHPVAEETYERLALPLIEQVRIDAGSTVQKVAEARLGIGGVRPSIQDLSQQLHVSKSRVYQHFDACFRIMDVRWPEGRNQLASLSVRWTQAASDVKSLTILNMVNGLFFPN